MSHAEDPRGEQLKRAAQLRAAIASLFSNDKGTEYDTNAIARKLESLLSELGYSKSDLTYFLKSMSDNKQLDLRKKGAHNIYSYPGSVPKHNGNGKQAEEKLKEVVTSRKVKHEVAKDIELVVNGTEILIGKNPLTGRLRIIIEG